MMRKRLLPWAGCALEGARGGRRHYDACCPRGAAALPGRSEIALFVYGSLEIVEVMRAVTRCDLRDRHLAGFLATCERFRESLAAPSPARRQLG
jgi:hypothetical protein